ncbi:oxidoreductase [bacterium]|nr:oxidoreductase [bacterium]
MSELHLPALELAIVLPLIGAFYLRRCQDGVEARLHSLIFLTATMFLSMVASWDFGLLHAFEAHDRWDLASRILGPDTLVIDELSAPLIPLSALLYLLTGLSTLRTKVHRVSFSGLLVSESILLATLSCKDPWGIIVLLILGTIPPFLELQHRNKSTRCFSIHMGLFLTLLVISWAIIDRVPDGQPIPVWALGGLMFAILIRSGCIPVHCWMTDLFEKATFASALLFVTPMVGAYAAMRLLVPISPDWVLRTVALISLLTSVYAAGMALVQRETRRLFCYLFLSHASLVLVGLELATPEGLAGGLAVWLSVGLSLGGFGLTLRAIEARMGRLSLTSFHGLYEHMPVLASFFLLTGLGSVGFPGTIGFIATEMLIDGAVQVYPYSGMAMVIAAALNSIAVMRVFFRIFTGTRHFATVSIRIRPQERWAVLTLSALIIGGGLYPQPGITSRHHAAVALLKQREKVLGVPSTPIVPEHPHEEVSETHAHVEQSPQAVTSMATIP